MPVFHARLVFAAGLAAYFLFATSVAVYHSSWRLMDHADPGAAAKTGKTNGRTLASCFRKLRPGMARDAVETVMDGFRYEGYSTRQGPVGRMEPIGAAFDRINAAAVADPWEEGVIEWLDADTGICYSIESRRQRVLRIRPPVETKQK